MQMAELPGWRTQNTTLNKRTNEVLSQPCAKNDEKVALLEVIADTLEESLRQIFSKEDNVRLDHSSTFSKSAPGNLGKATNVWKKIKQECQPVPRF